MQLFENCVCNKLIVSAPISYTEKRDEKKKQQRTDDYLGLQAYSAITGMPERPGTSLSLVQIN